MPSGKSSYRLQVELSCTKNAAVFVPSSIFNSRGSREIVVGQNDWRGIDRHYF